MNDMFKPLPPLAFGEGRATVFHDLEEYRQGLARVVPRLRSFDSIGPEPFHFKAFGVSLGSTHLLASANTPLRGHIPAPASAVVLLMLSGTSSVIVEGERYVCEPGTLLYIPEIDRFGETGTRSLLTIAVQRQHLLDAYEAVSGGPPGPSAAAVLSRALIVPPSRTPMPVFENILLIGRIIDLSLGNERALQLLALDDVLHRLIAIAIWPSLLEESGRTLAGADGKISMIEDYIRANLGSPIENSTLARDAGISTRLLHQMFMKKHGVSPAQWIRDLRLDQARTLLLDAPPDLRIRYIAGHCGFARLGPFTAHYRRRFGETPAETRERILRGV